MLRHDEPLAGDVDVETLVANMPPAFAVKGMFFTRYVSAIGDAWASLEPLLVAPPAARRYHAFEDYPMADYFRVFDHVARARFPGSPREAFRLLARGEVEVFAESTLGKVVFAMLRDPSSALLRYPDLFNQMTKGPRASSEKHGERHVVVTHERAVGAPEQAIGLIEGLVLGFEEAPTLDVTLGEGRFTVDVRW